MRKINYRIVMTLLACAAASANAQQNPAAAEPSNNGPSLEATMKFIQDKVNEQGEFASILSSQYTTFTSVNTIDDVVVNQPHCSFSAHIKQVAGGKLTGDYRQVTDLSAITGMKAGPESIILNGLGMGDVTYTPDYFMIFANVKDRPHAPVMLYFHDQETANRVAKALTHAIELCGGGDNSPF